MPTSSPDVPIHDASSTSPSCRSCSILLSSFLHWLRVGVPDRSFLHVGCSVRSFRSLIGAQTSSQNETFRRIRFAPTKGRCLPGGLRSVRTSATFSLVKRGRGRAIYPIRPFPPPGREMRKKKIPISWRGSGRSSRSPVRPSVPDDFVGPVGLYCFPCAP